MLNLEEQFRAKVGDSVRIHGLVTERGLTLNGRSGTIRSIFKRGNEIRAGVELEDGTEVALKQENIANGYGVTGLANLEFPGMTQEESTHRFQQHVHAKGDEIKIITGLELRTMQNLAMAQWGVQEHQKKGTCITCGAIAKGRIHSKEGHKQYTKTGICETCFDGAST